MKQAYAPMLTEEKSEHMDGVVCFVCCTSALGNIGGDPLFFKVFYDMGHGRRCWLRFDSRPSPANRGLKHRWLRHGPEADV